MESTSLPQLNYVGLLQEQCGKKKLNMPEYVENSAEKILGKYFKCTCKVGDFTSEGMGFNKKIAKQIAAREMYEKLEKENCLKTLESKGKVKSAVSKLYEYCKKEGKQTPLFSEKPEEDGLFVFSCTVHDFTSVGKGNTKKAAKETSAELVAQHFKIHKYIECIEKTKERGKEIKNPSQILHELCQSKKLTVAYQENTVNVGPKQLAFVAICTVGDLKTESGQNISKKQAKMEAASLMVNLLNISTPCSSPAVKNEVNKKLSDSSEGEASDNQEILPDFIKSETSDEGEGDASDDQEILSEFEGEEYSDEEPLEKRSRLFN